MRSLLKQRKLELNKEPSLGEHAGVLKPDKKDATAKHVARYQH